MPNLSFNEEPIQAQIKEFHQGLREYNAQFVKENFEPFAIIISAEGKTVGGINGETNWGRMRIADLWIAEDWRKQGLGRIMNLAEKMAKKRGCQGINVDPMTFQSPKFYENLG